MNCTLQSAQKRPLFPNNTDSDLRGCDCSPGYLTLRAEQGEAFSASHNEDHSETGTLPDSAQLSAKTDLKSTFAEFDLDSHFTKTARSVWNHLWVSGRDGQARLTEGVPSVPGRLRSSGDTAEGGAVRGFLGDGKVSQAL